jgi:predicted DNA-binding transcriptional regulator AlpA
MRGDASHERCLPRSPAGQPSAMSTSEARQAVLEAVRAAAVEAQANGELPIFLGELERVRIEILISVTGQPGRSSSGSIKDRLLSPAEAAERIGRSRWWVYQNKDALPIVRLPTGGYGFSERRLEQWIERRAAS